MFDSFDNSSPANDQPADAISPMPGRIQSWFIYLAGADPRLFPYLPSNEASDWTKLGVSLLVPFVLALCAGSLTFSTFMDSKNGFLALCGGFVWAVMILLIDMTVMSQLIKIPPPPPAVNTKPRRAYEQAAPPPPPPASSRQGFFVFMRISVALVLGVIMSHCIVLRFFENRILQVVEADRKDRLEKYEPSLKNIAQKEAESAEATKILNVSGDEAFLMAYDSFLAQYEDRRTGEKEKPVARSTLSASEQVLKDLRARYDALMTRQTDELGHLQEQFDATKAKAESYARDLDTANRMLLIEESGKVSDAFVYYTEEFKKNLPTVTSGKKSKGNRFLTMQIFVQAKAAEVTALTGEKEKLKSDLDALKIKQPQDKAAMETAIKNAEAQRNSTDAANRVSEQTKLAARTDEARQEVKTLLEKVNQEITRLKADYDKQTRSLKTGSHDWQEETEALVKLVLHRDNEAGALPQLVVAGVGILIMLGILMLDLTPLISKVFRPAGVYEDYVAELRSQRTNRWISARSISDRTSDDVVPLMSENRREPSAPAAPAPLPPRIL